MEKLDLKDIQTECLSNNLRRKCILATQRMNRARFEDKIKNS